MSWLAKLYETYEAGVKLDFSGEEKLMPTSHTLQNAHINIVIDGDGNFKRALVLEKTQVVLPATEKSAGRSSGEAPHPLADKIQYVAADYPDFGGMKKGYFPGYENQLAKWCRSEYGHKRAVAVHRYIIKGHVVRDLADNSVLHIDENAMLFRKWPENNGEPPAIFKVLPKNKGDIEQGDALICWSVESDGEPDSATWQDESLQQSGIAYDTQAGEDVGFCFVMGEEKPLAFNHP
nr:type I-C CRISPR-associated protein Cas8c/Csd1 [Deltaproteobacteria bacterium]